MQGIDHVEENYLYNFWTPFMASVRNFLGRNADISLGGIDSCHRTGDDYIGRPGCRKHVCHSGPV